MAILSSGNTKMGKIYNISLPPIKTCSGCEGYCGDKCYAMKFYKMRPRVRNAWDRNLELVTHDIATYFEEITNELRNKPSAKYFRWHVGGDILSYTYFSGMCLVAALLPEINFLCFTKQYEIVNNVAYSKSKIPSNLKIVFSAWPGMPLNNPHKFTVAWMQDGTERRIPETAVECSGSCTDCMLCFNDMNHDVVFHKH